MALVESLASLRIHVSSDLGVLLSSTTSTTGDKQRIREMQHNMYMAKYNICNNILFFFKSVLVIRLIKIKLRFLCLNSNGQVAALSCIINNNDQSLMSNELSRNLAFFKKNVFMASAS